MVGRRWMKRKTEDTLRRGVWRGSDWRYIARRDWIRDHWRNIFRRRRKILVRRGDMTGKLIRTSNCLHDGNWQGKVSELSGRRKIF